MMFTDDDHKAVTTARLLAMDAVENAGTGHPGTALALAPVAHLLFQKHLRHDPADPLWLGRDRFVLSCGHASILLYVQLYLTGYGLTLDDLRAFRTLDSRTPGHPELGHTPGVETTTGPLGQGLATAVGMAMAMRHERAIYTPEAAEGASVFDRTVWVLCSDGDLQEGLSYEAGALAGRHRLGNLVVVYDDNDIQIAGPTALTDDEDVAQRFTAQGWHVQHVGTADDGDIDVDALDTALTVASAHSDRPSLVVLKSQIAWPAPHAVNTAASHGAPLGADEVAATRTVLGDHSAPFAVDDAVLAHTRTALDRGAARHRAWQQMFDAWALADPTAADQWKRARRSELPAGLIDALPQFEAGTSMSTRDASAKVIQALAAGLPELWGGSADLADPNRTTITGGGSFLPETTEHSGPAGRNVHWGVREHAMAAAMNGIALVGGSRVYAGTFLVFSDYQRPAIRLAALMRLPVVHVWTHDSVAVGGDGPTHQPIEHLASLRAIPGLAVVRPADAAETVAAWVEVLAHDGPVGLVLARQATTVSGVQAEVVRRGVHRGAYVVRDGDRIDAVIVATGSEVELALAAADRLKRSGVGVRIVSMPCKEWFLAQDTIYRESVLPAHITARVVVEAATTFGWSDISGSAGTIVGIDEFGVSASGPDAQRARGMTVERVLEAVSSVMHGTTAD